MSTLAAAVVSPALLPSHLRPGDPWERNITRKLDGPGGPYLDPRRAVRLPTEREPLAVRLADARDEQATIASALERARAAGATSAVEVLTGAVELAAERVALLEGFGEELSRREESWRAASAAASEAERERDQNTDPARAVELRDKCEAARVVARASWRHGEAMLAAWRSTASPVCPELTRAAARRASLDAALDDVRRLAREHGADPLAVATEPLDVDAATRKGLGLEVPPPPARPRTRKD